jgi:hypothetical protein
MDLKPDIAMRSSDGTDPDRVRADLELLNKRITIIVANIKIISDMIDGLNAALSTMQAKEEA